MPRILVFGCRGMLGAALMDAFLASGFEAAGFDLPEVNITDAAQVEEAVAGFRPAAIFNAAGFTDVDGAEIQAERAFAVNATAVGHLARAARRTKASLWHFSTDYIFDGKIDRPYTEADEPAPLNLYAKSKLAGEIELRTADFTLIRTSWLFGPHGKNFVDRIIELAKTGGPLRVVDDQVGCPTYSRDLAGACIALLERNARGIINITNQGICSWYEFAKKIIALSPYPDTEVLPIKSSMLPRPARRPAYSALDNSKFATLIGRGLPSWEEALKNYLGKGKLQKPTL